MLYATLAPEYQAAKGMVSQYQRESCSARSYMRPHVWIDAFDGFVLCRFQANTAKHSNADLTTSIAIWDYIYHHGHLCLPMELGNLASTEPASSVLL
jgi:hypothetical protein